MFNHEYISMFLKMVQEILMFDLFYVIESQNIDFVMQMMIKCWFSKIVGEVEKNLKLLEVELVGIHLLLGQDRQLSFQRIPLTNLKLLNLQIKHSELEDTQLHLSHQKLNELYII